MYFQPNLQACGADAGVFKDVQRARISSLQRVKFFIFGTFMFVISIPVMCLASLVISHQRRTLKGWTDQCRRESSTLCCFVRIKSLNETQHLFCPSKINHIDILSNHFQSFSGSAEGNHVIPQEMDDDDDFGLVSDENDHFILV